MTSLHPSTEAVGPIHHETDSCSHRDGVDGCGHCRGRAEEPCRAREARCGTKAVGQEGEDCGRCGVAGANWVEAAQFG